MDLTIICVIVGVVNLALLVFLLLRKQEKTDPAEIAETVRRQIAELKPDIIDSVNTIGQNNLGAMDRMSQMLSRSQKLTGDAQQKYLAEFDRNQGDQFEEFRKTTTAQIDLLQKSTALQMRQLQEGLTGQNGEFRKQTAEQMVHMETRLQGLQEQTQKSLEDMRKTIADNMAQMRSENSKKLDEIRGTVDEKLQSTLEKRITESFKTVSEQLEQVYKGLGEMQNLASDVGGLKKVLSGVKTRGILGEIQLGAILEEILAPEQYETNVATIPGSTERVEYAVKLPGEGGTVYLPIDSKFPGDRYAQLLEAQESGDKAALETAYRALENVIRSEAKDISSKYVEVPYTTNFGIMFLPFEGLYAEVVNRGLVEVLQRDYKVNVAGPSTMAALLNSLQMGFRTLAIQKRSNEVWQVLGAVKTEFEKFEDAMDKMKKHLDSTSTELDKLMGTRTRAITRKLRSVQQLDEFQASQLLELGSPDQND